MVPFTPNLGQLGLQRKALKNIFKFVQNFLNFEFVFKRYVSFI